MQLCTVNCSFGFRAQSYTSQHAKAKPEAACGGGKSDGDASLSSWSREALRWTPSGNGNPAATTKVVKDPPKLSSPLGIDFGKARIGLATCPSGLISAPLKILDTKRRLWLELAEEIIVIAQQQEIDGFVVGLPVTSRGNIHQFWTDSAQGRSCRNFAQTLHAIARPHKLPVYLFDESQTSMDAAAALGLQNTSRLKQQGRLDAVAAALLLTAYFERPNAAIRVKSIKQVE